MKKHNEDETTIGWDSRQYYTRALVEVGVHFLGGSPKDPKDWLERLRDFFDWSCICIEKVDIEKIENQIEEIDKLLYAVKIDGVHVTQNERTTNKQKAYELIRKTFRRIHIGIQENEVYLPMKEVRDPSKAGRVRMG